MSRFMSVGLLLVLATQKVLGLHGLPGRHLHGLRFCGDRKLFEKTRFANESNAC